jgi:hypothetical protein
MIAKELTAENHRKRVMKRGAFKAIKREAKLRQEEKRIEDEHDKRKRQIDEYFERMKVKAREEEERAKLDKLERILKEQLKEMMLQAAH